MVALSLTFSKNVPNFYNSPPKLSFLECPTLWSCYITHISPCQECRSSKGICLFSPFITHSTLTFNQCLLNLLLMLFSSSIRYWSIFAVPQSRILSIAIEMKTLLHFYVSTSCIVYWAWEENRTNQKAIVTDILKPVSLFTTAPHYSEFTLWPQREWTPIDRL